MHRPAALLAAVFIHLVIGLSGIAVGLTLVAAIPSVAATSDVLLELPLILAIVGYGVLETVGAIGVWRGSFAAWVLAVVVDLAGVAVIAAVMSLTSWSDPVLLTGLAIWGIALLALPPTRQAILRGR